MSDAEQREEAAFEAARQLQGPERAAYLEQACAGNPALRERIEGLLGALERAGDLLSGPAVHRDQVSQATAPSPAAQPGDRIGRYKLLQQIGEGGCGVVYMAEQEEPVRRRVALKVIKQGMDTKQVIARFEAERQALALMEHPNIAKVLDAGATEAGRPYFVMELVRGVKITEFCDENQLPMKQRLELFIQVCQAVQHAHQKGVIHRDLKPSNILVTVNDGMPVPKVIDFGIAKATTGQPLTDKTVFTAFEQFIGTPAYMSPEQAVLTSLDVDTRSDIYSLGVLLYELLTGKTPFDQKELLAAGLDAMRRTIREKEPARPSTRLSTMVEDELTTTAKRRHADAPRLIHQVRGDLDWIVMKTLEKDRARRYETANGLARDVERHLNNEPVVARPPSKLYEFQKTVRRHKFGFAATAAIFIVLIAGIAASMWQAARATRAEREQSGLRQQAQANEKKAQKEAVKSEQVSRFLRTMLRGAGPSVALGRDATMLHEILDKTAADAGKELHGQPEAEAELRQTLGLVYTDLGDYEKAIVQFREGTRLYESVFGEQHTNLIVALAQLTWAQQQADNLAEAENTGRRAHLAEAENTGRRALALAEKVFHGDGTNYAIAAKALGLVLERQFYRAKWGQAPRDQMEPKRAEAERLQRRVLEILRTAYGEKHPEVATAMQNIAAVGTNEAERYELTLRTLEIRREVYPEVHPLVAFSLNNLGQFQVGRGELTNAEQSLRQALAINRKIYGDHHDQILWSLLHLGETLERQGDWKRAEEVFREALGNFRKYWPERSMNLTYHLDRLARVIRRQGRFAEAEPLDRERLAVMRQVRGSQPLEIEGLMAVLAYDLQQQARFAEAEALRREVLTNRQARLAATDGAVLEAKADLGRLLADWVWVERDSHPEVQTPQPETAARAQEAERLLRECLTLREADTNTTDAIRGDARSRVGGAVLANALADPALEPQVRQTRFTQAETLLLGSDDEIQKSRSSEQWTKRDSAERLLRLYLTWDKLDPNAAKAGEAGKWKQKLVELDMTP
jgi:eukaryotic-like serine/threonine-protein kinase